MLYTNTLSYNDTGDEAPPRSSLLTLTCVALSSDVAPAPDGRGSQS